MIDPKLVVASFQKRSEADPFEIGNKFKKALDLAIELQRWDDAQKISQEGVKLGLFAKGSSGSAVDTAKKEMEPKVRELDNFIRIILKKGEQAGTKEDKEKK